MKKPLIVSFSGGQTSAYMTYKMMNEHCPQMDEYEPYILFANTGCEHPKTLEFVRNCERKFGWNVIWLEAVIREGYRVGTTYQEVSFATAALDGVPYEAMIAKYGIPNTMFPHCTRELKQRPIEAWCRENLGTAHPLTAIGIRTDETRRVSKTQSNIIYPLIDWFPSDKQDVNDFWERMPFSLGLPPHLGNCVWCWKKSNTKLLAAMSDIPEAFDFPARMEKEYGIDRRGKPVTFFRQHRSTEDLRKMLLETGVPPEQMLDTSPCSESCEFIQTE